MQLDLTQPAFDQTPLVEWALAWAARGWPVFPLRAKDKEPIIPNAHRGMLPDGTRCRGGCGRYGHGVHDATTDPEVIRQWWEMYPDANIGGSTAGRIVLDIDVQHGGTEPISAPRTSVHWSGRGNGNRHLVYTADEGAMVRPRNNALGPGVDVKAGAGAYVVLPPSLHPDTHEAYWSDGHSEHTITDAELREIELETGHELTRVDRPTADARPLRLVKPESRGGSRDLLSSLLSNPPSEGGRNQWLTDVCGHYAKTYRRARDLYDVHAAQANALLTPPLDDAEYSKTVESIWQTEMAQHPERDATEDSGWVVSGSGRMLVQTKIVSGADTSYALEPFTDFDLIAHGVAIDANHRRVYWVTLRTAHGPIEATLDGAMLGDARALKKWLASFGCSWSEPYNAYPRMASETRILRYLEAQVPPQVRIKEALGWYDDALLGSAGGYVTIDGVITADGMVNKSESGTCADPRLSAASSLYGFSHTAAVAQEVLRQVLTFQEERVTSVYGAWWAATLVRHAIQQHTSLFPFCSIEASSGSGKTNGFFALMSQLGGSTRPQGTMTKAAARTIAAMNRNGVAWIDDMDNIDAIKEVLRAATSSGVMSKMDTDHASSTSIRVVSSVLVTGESLGFTHEKALIDRNVALDVKPPIGRMSVVPGREDRLQWEDVVELSQRFPEDQGGLAVLAGWFLQQSAVALRDGVVKEGIRFARSQRRKGRNGDKDLALLVGAHLLEFLAGQGGHIARVQEWISSDLLSGIRDDDNSLTLRVLPTVLRATRFQTQVMPGERGEPFAFTPAVIKSNEQASIRSLAKILLEEGQEGTEDSGGVEIHFYLPELARMWAHMNRGQVIVRTESEQALRQQAVVLGTDRVVKRVAGLDHRLTYRRLQGTPARDVLRRALDQD